MKREILFRGKSTSGRWVYGNLVISSIYRIQKWPGPGHFMLDAEIIKKTLGQYSTYQDQNKIKIFEGDICQDRFKRVMVCTWWNGRLQWFCSDPKNNFRYADLFQWLKKGKGFAKNETILSVEIIGNMTDNPLLFKNSNK